MGKVVSFRRCVFCGGVIERGEKTQIFPKGKMAHKKCFHEEIYQIVLGIARRMDLRTGRLLCFYCSIVEISKVIKMLKTIFFEKIQLEKIEIVKDAYLRFINLYAIMYMNLPSNCFETGISELKKI